MARTTTLTARMTRTLTRPLGHTAPVAAAGLLGGYLTAAATGVRPLGGVVLAVVGGVCTLSWYRSAGPATAGGLLAAYTAAFVASHPLAKVVGAWPSVITVSVAVAALAHLAVDRRAAGRSALTST